MSKINLNSKIGDFFKQNKIKLGALSMAVVMASTMTGCKNETKNNSEQVESSISQSDEKTLRELTLLVRNPDILGVLDVAKNNEMGVYNVIFRKEVPVYTTVLVGTRKVPYTSGDSIAYKEEFVYEKVMVGTNSESQEYIVSYEKAAKLGIDELLDSRIIDELLEFGKNYYVKVK